MAKEIEELKVKETISSEDKEILLAALDGINGWNFSPVAVITNGVEDYYFICKVKSVIKNLQMKMAKVYIKNQGNKVPKLLSIEEIN